MIGSEVGEGGEEENGETPTHKQLEQVSDWSGIPPVVLDTVPSNQRVACVDRLASQRALDPIRWHMSPS